MIELNSKENKAVKGSIWKSKTSNEYVRIELTAEGLIYFRPLTNNKSPRDVESMCRKRFLVDFKFEKDDDTLALYVSDADENNFAIVIDHGQCPERLVCKFINIKEHKVHTHVIGLIQFYRHYHLLSLDSLHEYHIIHNSIESIEQLKDLKPGAIWYHTNGGLHIAIIIKEENGTVSFVSSDNKALDLYWQMSSKEWVETYRLYDGVVKPQCFPEGSFDEMLEDTKGRYERVMERLKEGESKMENSKETYLKTDESKMKEFSSGAKREDKSGKGRYDLIPGDIMADFVNYAWEAYFIEGPTTICDTDISLNAYFDDVTDEKLFFEFILNMTCMFFTDHEKLNEITDSVGERAYVVTWENFHNALYKMRELLAKHYEAGAKVHGVNNWKKGIPVSDSERGGNFVDSMRRHTDQALRGLDDEPHAISAIWNAFCAIWTIRNKHTNTTNASETKPEVEIKSNDHEADKVPDKIADAPTVSYNVLAANINNCVELLSKMLDGNRTKDLTFEIHDAYVDLYMLCVLLKSVLLWFHDNDKARVCIEHIISGVYDLINTNIKPVRQIFDNVKAEWVEGYDDIIYATCLGEPDKYKILGIINVCGRTSMKLLNNDHFCGRQISNGVLFELKDHLDKLIKE